ncbi:pilus assembly protein PilZ [Lacimonas salitolerans]|uniref:Pilus assembly protein PilZ n=1 Tax=Lacimonas salitolerans TaxID=1323750 RepID=A0ABW4EFA7_9RHOB
MANAQPTPQNVTDLATRQAALPGRTPILIGTFGAAEALHALLRLPSGQVARVSPGDQVDGLHVTAIAPGMLQGERRGRPMTLTMPGN